MDRRNFLVSSAAALGAASQVFGTPSDTVRVACIGIGGRSTAHIGGYSKLPNVEIAAICDPDDSHIAKGLAQIDRWASPNRKPIETSGSCWKTRPSTRFPSLRPITGTL